MGESTAVLPGSYWKVRWSVAESSRRDASGSAPRPIAVGGGERVQGAAEANVLAGLEKLPDFHRVDPPPPGAFQASAPDCPCGGESSTVSTFAPGDEASATFAFAPGCESEPDARPDRVVGLHLRAGAHHGAAVPSVDVEQVAAVAEGVLQFGQRREGGRRGA